MIRILLSLVVLVVASVGSGATWSNLDESHRLGGRKTSEGYLWGKVVLLCRWDAADKSISAVLERMEDVWRSFKAKQLVVVGAPRGDAEALESVRKVAAAGKLTFPLYAEAGFGTGDPPPAGQPLLQVIDCAGKSVYRGRNDRTATQAVVTALTDMEAPRNVAQWKRFLDYEFEHLPCHFYLRLMSFNKEFPKEAAAYRQKATELLKDSNVKGVAKLVAFAKKAKDPPRFGPQEKAKRQKYEKLVNGVIAQCEVLKDVSDPRVAQEAKNALADLKWTQANF